MSGCRNHVVFGLLVLALCATSGGAAEAEPDLHASVFAPRPGTADAAQVEGPASTLDRDEDPSIPATPPSLPPATAVEIDGWVFQMIPAQNATIYYQETLPDDTVRRGWNAADWALTRVAEALGAPVVAVDVYFLESREELHRALAEYARSPRAAVYPGLRALSWTSEPHPGIYLDASYFTNAFRTTRIVAHEYAHQIVRRLPGASPLPQWFNEAVAETVGVRVAAEREPDIAGRRAFTSRAQVANAYGVGALQGLTTLVSSSQWSNAAAATDVTYALGWVAGERLAQDRGLGSFAMTFALMGGGISFQDAFHAVYGRPPEIFEAELQNHLTELLTQFPSGISVHRSPAPLGEFVQFVVVGLEAAEVIAREYVGPGGCSATGRGLADAFGFHEFRFRAEPDVACSGTWTVNVTGDQGSQSSATFVLTGL